MTAITPEVQVDKKPVVVISPPLDGENWWLATGHRTHRRTGAR